MAKKIKLLNTKIEIKPKHIEILLIVITLLMGIGVVYIYKNKIERELMEKYQNNNNNNNNKKLVLFYANWCGASTGFLPTWELLKGDSTIETLDIDVDLDANKQKTTDFKIEFLPTLFLVKGNNRIKYKGNRTLENIKSFYNNTNISNTKKNNETTHTQT